MSHRSAPDSGAGSYARGDALELLADGGNAHFVEPQPAPQGVVMGQQAFDLAPERQWIGQIHDADGAPPNLVLVGGADAPPGSAHARKHIGGFANRVELLVQRQALQQLLLLAKTGRRRDTHLLQIESFLAIVVMEAVLGIVRNASLFTVNQIHLVDL